METTKKTSNNHIDALDGIRTFGILLVSWFHLWELSWLSPYTHINNKLLNSIGIHELNIHTWVRFGFTGVDFLILLSAVVNFLPFAKSIVYDTDFPDIKEFFIKRAIRILPSYYLCLLIMLIIALVNHSYSSTGFLIKDLLTHLTFTGIFFKDVYTTTQLNGVLWTLQLEVLYYLLMPFIAKAFKKKPYITVTVMLLITLLTSRFLANSLEDAMPYNNFFPTFAGFYACGLLITVVYYYAKKNDINSKAIKMGALIGVIFTLMIYNRILNSMYDIDRFHGQLSTRFLLMLTIGFMTLFLIFSPWPIQKFMGNRVFKFINLISYNLFIWHQQVFRFLRDHHIPFWEGTEYPNVVGNTEWQYKYTFLSIIFSIIFASIITFAFELPVGRYLRRRFLGKAAKTTESKTETDNE
ncbi:MAG: acyltransferase [Eubacterium sp.]|nr:acyltransferase [Eubacterium sp.]